MKGEKANCLYCKKEFIKKMYTQGCCSQECSSKHNGKQIAQKIHGNRFKIFYRDDFKCFYCGKPSSDEDARLVIDHVTPQSRSGKDNYENVVTAWVISVMQENLTWYSLVRR